MKHYNIICICGAIIQFLFVWSPPQSKLIKLMIEKKRLKEEDDEHSAIDFLFVLCVVFGCGVSFTWRTSGL